MLRQTRQRLTQASSAIQKLYRCEKGAEGLEKLLIIGAIVIPLLGILVFFRGELTEWVGDMWDSVVEDSSNDYDPDGGF